MSISKNILLIVFFFIPCVTPAVLLEAGIIKFIFNIWRVVSFALIIIYAIKRNYKISKIVFCEIIFFSISIYTTWINRGKIFSAISITCAILTITVLSEIEAKKNIKRYLHITSGIAIILLLVDTFQIFSGIGYNPETNTSWLGYDNFAVFSVVPLLGIITLDSFLQKNQVTFRCMIMIIFVISAKLYTRATTASLSLLLWFTIIFIIGKVCIKKKTHQLLLGVLLISAILISMNFTEIFMWISKILGRETQIEHSRITIWKLSLQAIFRNPIWGYGVLEAEQEEFIIAGWYWSTCSHTHNYLLELAFRFGIVGLIPYLILIGDAIKFTLEKHRDKCAVILQATFMAQFLLWITDSYYAQTPFYVLLTLIPYVYHKEKEHDRENLINCNTCV